MGTDDTSIRDIWLSIYLNTSKSFIQRYIYSRLLLYFPSTLNSPIAHGPCHSLRDPGIKSSTDSHRDDNFYINESERVYDIRYRNFIIVPLSVYCHGNYHSMCD